jgi:hypothetical protein
MGKLSRWFGGSSETYFFGLQMAIKCFGEDTLRAKFARVLEESHESGDGVQEKRRFIKRFVALLEESELFWTYGYWDYYERADEATDEFHTWVYEIESALATEDEEIDEEIDDIQRTSNRKDFVVVTLAFLLDEPYLPVEAIGRENDYYLKVTITSLINGLDRGLVGASAEVSPAASAATKSGLAAPPPEPAPPSSIRRPSGPAVPPKP